MINRISLSFVFVLTLYSAISTHSFAGDPLSSLPIDVRVLIFRNLQDGRTNELVNRDFTSVGNTTHACRAGVYRMDDLNWDIAFERTETREQEVELLFEAAQKGNAKVVGERANKDGSLLIEKDYNGWTLAHQAAFSGRLSVIQLLAELAPDTFTVQSNNGETPMHQAATFGHLAVIEILAKHAPGTLSQKDKKGQTPAHNAAKHGSAAVIEVIAKHAPETFKEKDNDDWTPVHQAAFFGYADVLEVLAKHALDTFKEKDNKDRTPLDLLRATAVRTRHWGKNDQKADVLEELASRIAAMLDVNNKKNE